MVKPKIFAHAMMASYSAEIWAMGANALEAFFSSLASVEDKDMDVSAVDRAKGPIAYRREGKTGIVSIYGVLLKRVPSWMREYGYQVTGFDEIQEALAEARADDGVETICLHIESPGGMAVGLKEIADEIYAARQEKEVVAFADDLCASAAYYLASQADHVVSTYDALVGSIGTFSVIVDYSKAIEERGIKVHVIRSGPHKGLGVVGDKVTPEQLAGEQKIVDALTESFIETVARGRDMEEKAVRKLATGEVYLGHDAVDLKLVDSVGTAESVLQERPNSAAWIKENNMAGMKKGSNESGKDTPDLEALQADAAKEAAAKSVETLKALETAFPNDSAFARSQWEMGHDVEEARQDHYPVVLEQLAIEKATGSKLRAELSAKDEEIEKLKADLGAVGANALDVEPAAATGGDAEKAYNARIKELVEAGDKSPEATIANKQPELHNAYLQAVGSR